MPHWYPQVDTNPNNWATINNHLSGLNNSETSQSKGASVPRMKSGKDNVKSGGHFSDSGESSLISSKTSTSKKDDIFPLEEEESLTPKIIKVKVPKVLEGLTITAFNMFYIT